MSNMSLKQVNLANPANTAMTSLTCDDNGFLEVPSGVKGGLSTLGYMHVQDQKPAGTNGGDAVVGLNIRELNTVVTNTISGASLSANQITLPAGEYVVNASVPATQVGRHRAQLYNVTDLGVSILGSSEFSTSAETYSVTRSFILAGRLTITSSKTFSLRHYVESGKVSNGLGVSSLNLDGNASIYSDIQIWKVG